MHLDDQLILELKQVRTREKAFDELRHKLILLMRNKLKHSLGVDDDFVEDAVQETLLVVLSTIDNFRRESRFHTWVCGICMNISLVELRKKRSSELSLDELISKTNFELESPTAQQFTERVALAEKLKVVEAAIETKLTDKQRFVVLAGAAGIDPADIACALKTSRGAVYKLTHDARRALKKHLDVAGFTYEEVRESVPA